MSPVSLQVSPELDRGMNREGAPGKSPEEMYIQQKVRVLLMLRKMGSNVSACGPGGAALEEGRGLRARGWALLPVQAPQAQSPHFREHC